MNLLQAWWDHICAFFQTYVVDRFVHITWIDVADILILAAVLYAVYRFARTRRAGRVLVGLVVVIIAGIAVTLLRLPSLSYLVRIFSSAAFFCIVLIFQPEIRDGLERIGNSKIATPGSDTLPRKQLPAARRLTSEVVDAVFKLSEARNGALIVFEGLTRLGDWAESGKSVDAGVTSHLLQNIFYDKAPLHDGALIIRDMRIWMASCVLPSTKSQMDFGNMGTRHRAAVGITEVSDALVVVVSEQSGKVSVAQDGKLVRGLDAEQLSDILMTYLAGNLYLRTKRQEERAARAVAAMEEKNMILARKKEQLDPELHEAEQMSLELDLARSTEKEDVSVEQEAESDT